MKKALLTLFVILSISTLTRAQDTNVVYEKSIEINKFAEYIRNVKHFYDSEDCCIEITLIECSNSIKNLSKKGLEETALFNLYFRILLLAEESIKPSIRNFWVEGGYHNPRNYKFEPKGRRLTFIHGTEKESINISITFAKTGVQVN